jgi:amino acid transporter
MFSYKFSFVPTAYAQDSITDVINDASEVVSILIYTFMALVIAALFIGFIKIIRTSQSAGEVKEGKKAVLYGLIGVFLVFTMWGVAILISNEILGDSSTGGEIGEYGADGSGPTIRAIFPQLPTGE